MNEPSTGETKQPTGPRSGGFVLRLLSRISQSLCVTANGIGAVCCFGLCGVVAYSVFMRYVVNEPQTWADEFSGYLMVLMVMLGVAEALRRNDHIGVDLLTQKLSPAWKYWTGLWATLSVIVMAFVLLKSSIEMVEFSHMVGLISEGYVEVEMWIPQSAVPLGMGLLLIAAVTRLLQQLAAGPSGKHEAP